MTHFRERHVCQHNVNIGLVMSPNVIHLTLSVSLVSNYPIFFPHRNVFFPGSFCPVWSTRNLSQVTAEPLPDVPSDAEPLNLGGFRRFQTFSLHVDLWRLGKVWKFWWRK